jgi:hypothetical protein
MRTTDPIYHGAADFLPDQHLMANESQYCAVCGGMVHAFNNETMQDWFETYYGPVCFECFAADPEHDSMPGPGSVLSDEAVRVFDPRRSLA